MSCYSANQSAYHPERIVSSKINQYAKYRRSNDCDEKEKTEISQL